VDEQDVVQPRPVAVVGVIKEMEHRFRSHFRQYKPGTQQFV
jgi:hypothetical protein